MQIPRPTQHVLNETGSGDRDATVTTMVFKEVEHAPPTAQREFYDPNLRLMKLFMLDSRSALIESLYVSVRKNDEDTGLTDYTQEISSGGDILRLKKRATTAATRTSRTTAGADDYFVVDDLDESISRMAIQTADLQPYSIRIPTTSQWTVDYSPVYSAVTGKQQAYVGRFNVDLLPERGFGDCLVDLHHQLSSSPFSGSITAETL